MVVVRGEWTSEALEEVIDTIGIGTCFFMKGQQVMEHTFELPLWSFKWLD